MPARRHERTSGLRLVVSGVLENITQSVYEAAGGNEGLLRLAEAWHSQVMSGEVVGRAFSHRFHPRHSERLAAYWAEALEPTTYSGTDGDETSAVRIHSGNGPHEEAGRRVIACFDPARGSSASQEWRGRGSSTRASVGTGSVRAHAIHPAPAHR